MFCSAPCLISDIVHLSKQKSTTFFQLIFNIFYPLSCKSRGEGIKYASLHFLCDSTYPGKRIFKMTEICQVHRDIAYLSQRKQKFLEHLRTFHWFLGSSFAQNIIIQANHIKNLLIIHWINCFIKVIEF